MMAPVSVRVGDTLVEGPHAIAETHRTCCDYTTTGVACDHGEQQGPAEWVSIGEAMVTVEQLPELIEVLGRVLRATRPPARATQVLDRMFSAAATTVTVIDAEDDAEALEEALRAAGETRDSLYGWDVGRADDAGVRTVRLHTS